jgi:hypothetical protein
VRTARFVGPVYEAEGNRTTPTLQRPLGGYSPPQREVMGQNGTRDGRLPHPSTLRKRLRDNGQRHKTPWDKMGRAPRCCAA